MNRLDRITSILVQLQSKKLITAREVSDRFEISIRTVYRDIHTLRQAGVPIGEEEGKGYFIVEGYELPPVMFSSEEANALVAIEKILNYHTEDSLRRNYESALIKIKAVLKSNAKNKLEYLNSRIAYNQPWAPKSSHLETVQQAITEHFKVTITYHSKSKGATTKRTIHPYALYFTGAVWTTIAFCELRKELREFRLDRITLLERIAEAFNPDTTFNLDAYIEERSKKVF
ncbi:MAG: YafY family transcriptional regulator [Roseivirga sp.]|nr:YafY family transcriptional regulator [Roseivirga sp.]